MKNKDFDEKSRYRKYLNFVRYVKTVDLRRLLKCSKKNRQNLKVLFACKKVSVLLIYKNNKFSRNFTIIKNFWCVNLIKGINYIHCYCTDKKITLHHWQIIDKNIEEKKSDFA